MAKTDLTTNSYHSLNSLDKSIQAFVEFAHVLPEEDRFAPLLLVLADRLESDFTAMRNDVIRLFQEPKDGHAKGGAR
ncbi:hypothetical protein [Aeromonas veronii]|uniref:hypothetical protein n=1 Tax=Aeromonas veronii TaxID=654 RepID=UPI003F7A8A57